MTGHMALCGGGQHVAGLECRTVGAHLPTHEISHKLLYHLELVRLGLGSSFGIRVSIRAIIVFMMPADGDVYSMNA